MTTRISKTSGVTRKRRLEPRKQPVQQRSKATVEYLLDAAAQVFEAYGFAAGTTNRIAERAGVSIGTLYQYFPSKEALAVALLERHIAEGMQRLNEWAERGTVERMTLRESLQLFVEGMIELHAERPRLQHILLEETPLPPRVHDALLASDDEAARIVAGLLRRHREVRHPRVLQCAVMAVQTVESLTHRFAAHPGHGLPREDFVNELVGMLETYLTRQ